MPAPDAAAPGSPGFLAACHLLLLDGQVEPSDVAALISNRQPELAAAQPGPGGIPERRLSRHSRLVGPVLLDAPLRAELGLPAWARAAFALAGPRDREAEPPPEWVRRADELASYFPAGLPDREEGRGLALLVALARRLHTAVRCADEASGGTAQSDPAGLAAAGSTPGQSSAERILTPDPDAHIDLVVYSHYWLAPDVLLERVRAVAPGARMPLPVSAEALERLGAEIDPAEPIVLDGYAVEVDLAELGPEAGLIEIGVLLEEAVPGIVAAHAAGPQIAYRLRWQPLAQDLGEALDTADPAVRRMRAGAAERIEALAGAIMRATAGIALDHDGFLVSERQLG